MSPGVDRSTFCARVGIHDSTLAEWLNDGIVEPLARTRGPQTFAEDDVRRGRKIRELEKEFHGRYSRKQLAEIVDEERKPDPWHSPPGAPDLK